MKNIKVSVLERQPEEKELLPWSAFWNKVILNKMAAVIFCSRSFYFANLATNQSFKQKKGGGGGVRETEKWNKNYMSRHTFLMGLF